MIRVRTSMVALTALFAVAASGCNGGADEARATFPSAPESTVETEASSLAADGYNPARLVLDPGVEPSPDSHQLAVWIKEWACANGEAPIGREVVPVVVADAERIVITVMVEPQQGSLDCPDNPWHPVTVTLDEPLGDRKVYDGSVVPPRRRVWPPSPEVLNQ